MTVDNFVQAPPQRVDVKTAVKFEDDWLVLRPAAVILKAMNKPEPLLCEGKWPGPLFHCLLHQITVTARFVSYKPIKLTSHLGRRRLRGNWGLLLRRFFDQVIGNGKVQLGPAELNPFWCYL